MAGLLAVSEPAGHNVDPAALAEGKARAGQGFSLVDLVSAERGDASADSSTLATPVSEPSERPD